MACELPTHASSPSLAGCFFDDSHRQQQHTDSTSQSDNSDVASFMYCVEESQPNTLFLQSNEYLMQIRKEHDGSETIDEDDEDECAVEFHENEVSDSSNNNSTEEDYSDCRSRDEFKTENKNTNTDRMNDMDEEVHVEDNKDSEHNNKRLEYVRWADVISESDYEENYRDPFCNEYKLRPEHKESDEFIEEWDVWYDSPKANLTKKGMFRDEFEGSLRCLARIRSMKDINALFQQFGERLELIPVDGTVAVCRLGVKPVWEDASHSDGGRLKVRKFPHDLSEVFFRKLLKAFVLQQLPFFEYLTCVSLQVKSQIASQKTDVLQIWHCRFPCRTISAKMTKQIRTLLASEPFGYNSQGLEIYGLENHTAVARNDVKLSQAGLVPKLAVKQKHIKVDDKAGNVSKHGNKSKLRETFRQPIPNYINNCYNNHYPMSLSTKQNMATNNSWQPKNKKKKQKSGEIDCSEGTRVSSRRYINQPSYQHKGGTQMRMKKCISNNEAISCDTDTPVATQESKFMHFNSHARWSQEFAHRQLHAQTDEPRKYKSRVTGALNLYGARGVGKGNQVKKEMTRKKDKKQWHGEQEDTNNNEPSGYYIKGCWYPLQQ